MKETLMLQKHLAGTLCSYSKNEGKDTQSSTCRWSRPKSRISYLSGMIGLQMRSSRDVGMITQVHPSNETLSFLAHFSVQLPQKIVKQDRIFCNLAHWVLQRKVWSTLQKRVRSLCSNPQMVLIKEELLFLMTVIKMTQKDTSSCVASMIQMSCEIKRWLSDKGHKLIWLQGIRLPRFLFSKQPCKEWLLIISFNINIRLTVFPASTWTSHLNSCRE